MDKKQLAAFNNLADALDDLVTTLNSNYNSSQDATRKQTDQFNNSIESLANNIEELKENSKQMLANQETLLKMSKEIKENQKSNNFLASDDKKKKSLLKDGTSTIILMAGAILALGAAFNIIGSVDPITVLTVGITIYVLSEAFKNLAEIKEFSIGNIMKMGASLIAFSGVIAISSYILGSITPIGLMELITGAAIAFMFYTISPVLSPLVEATKNLKATDLFKLPAILVGVSTAIMLSSHILKYIAPISIAQGLTAILIGTTFMVIGFTLGDLVYSLKNIKPKDVITLPAILFGIATAITGASWIMQLITPISLYQGLTAIAIATTLAIASIGLAPLIFVSKSLTVKDVVNISLLLVGIATALTVSSWILQGAAVIPFMDMLNLMFFGLSFAVTALLISVPMVILGLIPTNILIQGGIALGLIAIGITAASWILSLGTYSTFPSLGWALGVSASLLGFGLTAVVMGGIVMSGIGAIGLAAGLLSFLAIAPSIVAVSKILTGGTYGNYPTLAWAGGVGLALATFGAAALGMGIGSLFGFDLTEVMVDIATAIQQSSLIIAQGVYTKYPTMQWAGGVASAIMGFAPALLLSAGLFSLFSGGKSPAMVISETARAINEASHSIAKGNYSIFPTKKWASGVSSAITSFYPVIQASTDNGIFEFFGGGSNNDKIIESITGTATAMQLASISLANGNYSKYPSEQWSKGVGKSIQAFLPIIKMVTEKSFMSSVGDFLKSAIGNDPMKELKNMLSSIGDAMVTLSNKLSQADFSNVPPANYGSTIKDSINGTLSFLKDFDKDDYFTTENGKSVFKYADKINILTNLFNGQIKRLTDSTKSLSLPNNLNMSGYFKSMMEGLNYLGQVDTNIDMNNFDNISTKLDKITSSFDRMNTSLVKVNGNLATFKGNTGSIIVDSSVVPRNNTNINQINPNNETASVINSEETKLNVQKTLTPAKNDDKRISDLYMQMEAMNMQLATIASNSSNISSYIAELRVTSTDATIKK